MVVSLRPERLKRYKDVAMLLIKYGRSDLISAAGLEGSVLPDEIGDDKSGVGSRAGPLHLFRTGYRARWRNFRARGEIWRSGIQGNTADHRG